MADETDLQKLDGKIALFTFNSYITGNCDEVCDYINKAMNKLEKDGYVKYLFDLKHLNIINSHFIGLIAKRHYSLSQKGGQIAILKAQKMVNRSFELSGLADILHFFSDQTEAVNSFEN